MENQNNEKDVMELLSSKEISLEKALRTANDFVNNNELEKAFPFVCYIADSKGSSASDAIMAGVISISLNNKNDAEKYFNLAIQKDPDNYDALYNLAILKINQKKYHEGLKLLRRLEKKQPDNFELKNDLGVALLNLESYSDAVTCWQHALGLNPNYSVARNNAMEYFIDEGLSDEALEFLIENEKLNGLSESTESEIKHWRRILNSKSSLVDPPTIESEKLENKKIAIFASIDTFITDIRDHLSLSNEIKMFKSGTQQEMESLMNWADIAWFEWCDNFLIAATSLEKKCKIVCRLHSYEAFTEMPSKVDWSKVDLLLFVNQSVCDIFQQQVHTRTPIRIVHNAVDLNKYCITPEKKYGKEIASVGYINYKKNPALLLYCFKKIYEYDNEYSLHMAGQHQDSRIELYFNHFLKENPLPVYFDGWVDDMPKWYEDKDFVISTSLFESFHYSIAEGMASGLMPLIHNWYGSKNLYPEEYLFSDPDNCLSLLKQFEKADRKELSSEHRMFIEKNYSLIDKLSIIDSILNQLVNESPANVKQVQKVS